MIMMMMTMWVEIQISRCLNVISLKSFAGCWCTVSSINEWKWFWNRDATKITFAWTIKCEFGQQLETAKCASTARRFKRLLLLMVFHRLWFKSVPNRSLDTSAVSFPSWSARERIWTRERRFCPFHCTSHWTIEEWKRELTLCSELLCSYRDKRNTKNTPKGSQKSTPQGSQKLTPRGGQKFTPRGGQNLMPRRL